MVQYKEKGFSGFWRKVFMEEAKKNFPLKSFPPCFFPSEFWFFMMSEVGFPLILIVKGLSLITRIKKGELPLSTMSYT